MDEMFPVAAGAVLGLVVASLIRGRVRIWILSGSSVLLGMTASWLSGELAVSWIYLWFDIAQVLAAAAMTWLLWARWGHLGSAVLRRP